MEHDKFNYFCYYKADVRYENEVFPLYLNVGKGKNDGKYHVYDITNKIRDTADRINGLERPKPNEGYALTNDVSEFSIPNSSENVNSNSIQENAENTETNLEAEDMEYSVGLTDTEEFDTKKFADELIEKYGENALKQKQVSDILDSVFYDVLNSQWSEAYSDALKIAEGFANDFENVEQIGYSNILRHLKYTLVNHQVDYLSRREQSKEADSKGIQIIFIYF